MAGLPSVSVVIPTANGRNWHAAVASAFGQRQVAVEVLLVDNGSKEISGSAEFPDLRIIRSDPSAGANGARQAGIVAARFDFIALLDDDDVWHPDKLIRQWQHVSRAVVDPLNAQWLCGVGKYIVEEGSEDLQSPKVFPTVINDAAEYLFKRTGLTSSRNQLQSSTLLFPKSVAIKVPFDPSLRLHQDWNWILDVEDRLSAQILICPEYLVNYTKGTSASITSRSRALHSLAWSATRLGSKSRRIRGDFALTVPFNMSLEKGSYLEAVGILCKAVWYERPGVPASTRAVMALIRYPLRRVIESARAVTGVSR